MQVHACYEGNMSEAGVPAAVAAAAVDTQAIPCYMPLGDCVALLSIVTSCPLPRDLCLSAERNSNIDMIEGNKV